MWRDLLVMVLHMSASTVHVHRLNILSTSVTLHMSRVLRTSFSKSVQDLSVYLGDCVNDVQINFNILWLMLSFVLCCGDAITVAPKLLK